MAEIPGSLRYAVTGAPGARANDRRQSPGARRIDGADFAYSAEVIVSYLGGSDTIAHGTRAQLWGVGGTTLDLTTTRYVIFTVAGSGALYAAPQETWTAVSAANTVIGLEYSHWDGWQRWQMRVILIPGAVGWSGGNPAGIPADNYASSSHGNYGYAGTGSGIGGSVWFDSANQMMGSRRIAMSLLGAVLVATSDGLLWYLATPDSIPGVQVQYAIDKYAWINGITYNFTTNLWWLLDNANKVYSSASAAPLVPADWTLQHDWGDLNGVFVGVGPNGDVLLNDPSRVSHWQYGYVNAGTPTVVDIDAGANTFLDPFFTASEPGQSVFGVDCAVLQDPGSIGIGFFIDKDGNFDNSEFFAYATSDNAGAYYAITFTGTLLHGSAGSWATLIDAATIDVGYPQLLQFSPVLANTLTIISQFDGSTFTARSRVTQVDLGTLTVTHQAPWDFEQNFGGAEGESTVVGAASNL